MKIHFGIQVVISIVLGGFAYLLYQFNLLGWVGFLAPLSVLVGISAFCNGQWRNNIRQRYIWNGVFSIFVYISLVVILLDGFLSLVRDVPLADKFLNMLPEARVVWGTLIAEIRKLFSSQPELVQVSGRIKWSYILLPIHLIWCSYNIWGSYGKKFMITSASIVVVVICYFCFRPSFELKVIQWHAIWLAGFLALFFANWYLLKHPDVV